MLDLHDVHLGSDPLVDFRHLPEVGSLLENKLTDEGPVALPEETGDALERYIDHHRYGSTTSTVRNWSYLATEPCRYSDRPHGKQRDTCEWTEYQHGSKCPSCRAPHHIRTTAIT